MLAGELCATAYTFLCTAALHAVQGLRLDHVGRLHGSRQAHWLQNSLTLTQVFGALDLLDAALSWTHRELSLRFISRSREYVVPFSC